MADSWRIPTKAVKGATRDAYGCHQILQTSQWL